MNIQELSNALQPLEKEFPGVRFTEAGEMLQDRETGHSFRVNGHWILLYLEGPQNPPTMAFRDYTMACCSFKGILDARAGKYAIA